MDALPRLLKDIFLSRDWYTCQRRTR